MVDDKKLKNLASPQNPIRINQKAYITGDKLPPFLRCKKCKLTYPKLGMVLARKRNGSIVGEHAAYCRQCQVKMGFLAKGAVIRIDHEIERSKQIMKELVAEEDKQDALLIEKRLKELRGG